MNSILITGCNRGLGLGFIKHLVKEPKTPNIIIATCRNIEKATELTNIAKEHSNVKILTLEVKDVDKFEDFAKQVAEITKDQGLNVLYNNAATTPKFTRIGLVKPDQMLECFTVNTLGPLMLTKALLPLLQKASANNKDKPMGISKAAIINMSSTLGSIQLNADGGFYPYRCSKSALNMTTKTLSIDLKKDQILVASIHPGWVKTDLGGPKAPLEIHDSVSGIFKVLNSLNETHNGKFFQYDGKQLDW